MTGSAGDVLHSRDEGPPPRRPGRLRRLVRRRDLRAVVGVVAAAAAAAGALAGGAPGLLAGSGPRPSPSGAAQASAVPAAPSGVPPGTPVTTVLEAALLRPADVDLVRPRVGPAPAAVGRLQGCGPAAARPLAARRTTVGEGGRAVDQRVWVGLDAPDAGSLYAGLVLGLRSCDAGATTWRPLPGRARVGDDSVLLTDGPGGTGAAVALVRVGSVVTRVLLHPGNGPRPAPGTIAGLAATAVVRLRVVLPVETSGGLSTAPAAVTRIPRGFRLGTDPAGGPAGTARVRGRRTPWEIAPCGGPAYPTDGLRSAMLTVTQRGMPGTQVRQVALFRDLATAAAAYAGLRDAVVGCALGRPGTGVGARELWTSRPLALGRQGLLAVGRYRLDGRPVSGNAHAVAVQVGNAVYVRVDYRDGLPGEPDPYADEAARAATADLSRVRALLGPEPPRATRPG